MNRKKGELELHERNLRPHPAHANKQTKEHEKLHYPALTNNF
jgi:hypothetical protein